MIIPIGDSGKQIVVSSDLGQLHISLFANGTSLGSNLSRKEAIQLSVMLLRLAESKG